MFLNLIFKRCSYYFNRMSVAFLFYSHTEYKDLWPILADNIKKLPTQPNKYICINETNEDYEVLNTNFTKVIRYKYELSYPQKLLYVLSQINEKYVVLIHDNDLIVSFDNNDYYELMELIYKKNIHRCMFGVVGNNQPEFELEKFSIGTSKLSTPHHMTPYDVGPSIWNKYELEKALETVKDYQYRNIEQSPIQSYCLEKLNMYGFYKHKIYPSKYVIGRPFPNSFQFLHICGQGKLFEKHLYMDQQTEFENLIQKYPQLSERGYLMNQNHIQLTHRSY